MVDRLIEFSVRNRLLVLLLTIAGCGVGWWSMQHVALDAIPDLSETQVIIYSKWDRSPNIIEDQVTYPIVTALTGAPKVKSVRAVSDFGYSYVYVIFEDGTDPYWARSRSQEYLAAVIPNLPKGVTTSLGPDATGLGWGFQYVLVDKTGKHNLAEMRSIQDWYLRYNVKSVSGVSEVAAVGGYGKQYQVNVDPLKLKQFGIGINRVVDAVRESNEETGARLLEFGGAEYMVRGIGYLKSVDDIENSVVAASESGTPIRVRDVGQVVVGPDLRRGLAEFDGKGEAVSGIVVIRDGQNMADVIGRVKQRINELKGGLPEGVEIVPVYDRSELIQRSVSNLRTTILEIVVTVALIILLFLWHVPSAMIPVVTIPVALLLSFIPFRFMGVTANIMSLGGLAIAIGALVDASIVVVEQTHKKMEAWEAAGRPGSVAQVVITAVKEVARPSFFALLIIGISFLPVLTLEGEEGRLFKPLAYTKTLAMITGALLAITLDPALRVMVTRMKRFNFKPAWLAKICTTIFAGEIHSESKHPVSKVLIKTYGPVLQWCLRNKTVVLVTAVLCMAVTVPVALNLGSELMPPLEEGSVLYMPTTLPSISITEARKILTTTDQVLMSFPEVDHVIGKAGRADTATDPAPLSMLETVITLKPESQWRKVPTWYSRWSPDFMKPMFRHFTPDHISMDQLIAEMNAALKVPGLSNAWTMPIRGRIDMLTTGMRTPVGLKVMGADLATIQKVGLDAERVLASVPGARKVFAERTADGYFVDVVWKRDQLARYGISMARAEEALASAVGGDNITTTVEGRERYPVNVRYQRDFRSDVAALNSVFVTAGDDAKQIPIGELAEIRKTVGPSMIRDEDGMATGYVYVDLEPGMDTGTFVHEGQEKLAKELKLPAGYTVRWTGQFEAMDRVRQRLAFIVPLTLFVVFVLLWFSTRSLARAGIVLLAVPFSAIGAFWIIALLGYKLSIAVWIGLIALLGVDAETGVFMLLYMDLAYDKYKSEGRMNNIDDLKAAIYEGAVRRIRPKFMTVATMFVGLVPVLWSTEAGSQIMKHIAAPMIGGIFTSFLLELILYPIIYELWHERGLDKQQGIPADGPRVEAFVN